MYCVHNGRVCVMVYDANKMEWVYIPEEEFKEVFSND
jgi:hypothetical protein